MVNLKSSVCRGKITCRCTRRYVYWTHISAINSGQLQYKPIVRLKVSFFFLFLSLSPPAFMHPIFPCWDQTGLLFYSAFLPPLPSAFPNILRFPSPGLKEAYYLTVLLQGMQLTHIHNHVSPGWRESCCAVTPDSLCIYGTQLCHTSFSLPS